MFWDLFLRRLYRTFGALPPANRSAGLAVVIQAHHFGYLNPATLDDLSILALLALCPPGTTPHGPAQAEFLNAARTLGSAPHVDGLLSALAPPDHLNHLLLHRHGTAAQRTLVYQLLRPYFVRHLDLFLTRLYLEPPGTRAAWADGFLYAVLRDYAALASHAEDFTVYLYRRLLRLLGSATPPSLPAPPDFFPAPPLPPWLAALPADERNLIQSSFHLPGPADRVRLFLSLYADLSSREIHGIHFPTWTAQEVIQHLQASYLHVL